MRSSPKAANVPVEPLPSSESGEEQRLVEALAEYHEAADSGRPWDREAFLARYGDIREELAGYLDSFDFVRAVAPELGETSQSPGAAASLLSERALLGDFRIIREIGRGGMGIVYEAEQMSVGRRVALKVLPFAAMLQSQQHDRFHNEVRAAGSLSHPHIVTVHSVGQERGVHYYAMQLVEGRSLAETIAQLRRENLNASPSEQSPTSVGESAATQPLAELSTVRTKRPDEYWRTVATLGSQAAEALDHAHRRGVIHRDVKPANLLVGNDEQLWVADFGLARLETDISMTMSGDLLGTLRYMSPEQAGGDRAIVDHRTDVYSLGVTLYELLALHPAFSSNDRGQLLHDVTSSSPTPLRKFDSRVPADLDTIVAKAIEKDPADRYATAGEMAADLHAFVEHRPINARPPSLANRAQKWSRRHAAFVTSALVVLVLGVIGLSVSAALLGAANRRVAAQRNEAESNLRLAADAVDRLLAEMGQVASERGQLPEAERFLDEAQGFYQQLIDKSSDTAVLRRAAAASNHIGDLEQMFGRHELAIERYQTALALLERAALDDYLLPEIEVTRAKAHGGIGTAHSALLGARRVEVHFNLAREIWLRLLKREPNNEQYIDGLVSALNGLAVVYSVTERLDEADQAYERIVELMERLPAASRQTAGRLNVLAGARCNQGTLAVERGRLAAADPLLRSAVALQQRVTKLRPEIVQHRHDLYVFQWNLVDLLVRQEKYAEASTAAEELAKSFPERLRAQYEAADLLLRSAAGAEATTADPNAAGATQRWRETARGLVTNARPSDNTSVDSLGYFGWFLSMCRDKSLRDPARALNLVGRSLAQAPDRGFLHQVRAVALYRLGKYEEAIETIQPSNQISDPTDAVLLAMAHWRLGDRREAERCYKQAQQLDHDRQWLRPSVYDFLAEAREQIFAEARSMFQAPEATPDSSAATLP